MESHEIRLALQRNPAPAPRVGAARVHQLAALYDAAAPRWHRRMHAFGYPRAYARLFARLRDGAWLRRLDGGGRVLDCGVGTGVLSLALAQVAPVAQVVGVDISPLMLREAAARIAGAGIRTRMHCADAQRLPLPDQSFDACVCAHTLEHLADPHRAVAEMVRVLKRGAPLLIIATRDGCADRLLRLKWRHAFIPRARLIAWLREAGVANIADQSLGSALMPAHWLSHAIYGCRS